MAHTGQVNPEILQRLQKRRGKIHVFDTIAPAKTALLVIDMQPTFVAEGSPAEVPVSRVIVPAINDLAAHLREAGGAVYWITHANQVEEGKSDWPLFYDNFVADEVRAKTIEFMLPGAAGTQLWHELKSAENDRHIIKNRYSAMIEGSSDLPQRLKKEGIETLLIAGTKTNVCCESTARDAMMLGYQVIMVSDCLAALSDQEHWGALETILQQFGDVYTSEETQRLFNR